MMLCGHEIVMMLFGPDVLMYSCLNHDEVLMAHVVCRFKHDELYKCLLVKQLALDIKLFFQDRV